jgi:hypothetical protein
MVNREEEEVHRPSSLVPESRAMRRRRRRRTAEGRPDGLGGERD